MSTRRKDIDCAKGVAIILVVMGHLVQNNLTGKPADTIFNFIYSFHMPLFFFLSGYVVSLKKSEISISNAPHFILRKIQTLVIPFIFAGIIFFPLLCESKSLMDLPNIFVRRMIDPLSSFWFLPVLFCIQIYFLLACLIKNCLLRFFDSGQSNHWSLLCDIVSQAVVILAIIIASNFSTYIHGSCYFSIVYILLFFLGADIIQIKGLYGKFIHHSSYSNLFYLLLLFIFFAIATQFDFKHTNSIIKLASSICASLLLLKICSYYNSNNKWEEHISFFGENSLVIYINHGIIVSIFLEEIDVSCLNTVPLFCILVVIAMTISVISIVISLILRRIPLLSTLMYGR